MGIWKVVVLFVRGFLAKRAALAAENLALRQQLAVGRSGFAAGESSDGGAEGVRG